MTIKEIAERAGVSIATVSLALNGKSNVKEETKQVILELARECGYTKKNMKPKKSILLVKYVNSGISIDKNGNFITELIDAIENTASKYEYNIAIKNVMASDWQKDLSSINQEDFSGIIFLATEAQEDVAIGINNMDIPVVAVDNMFEYTDIDSIVMDNRGGIYDAVKYLYDLGHREIGFIDSYIKFDNILQRTEGYEKAVERLKLTFKDEYKITIGLTLESAYQDMLTQLNRGIKLPTAYVAANDTLAIGVIKALKEFGIQVPEQVSIIGFDDIPYCVGLDKPLTTMKVSRDKLGEQAIKMLVGKINENHKEGIKLLVRTQLVERESVRVIN